MYAVALVHATEEWQGAECRFQSHGVRRDEWASEDDNTGVREGGENVRVRMTQRRAFRACACVEHVLEFETPRQTLFCCEVHEVPATSQPLSTHPLTLTPRSSGGRNPGQRFSEPDLGSDVGPRLALAVDRGFELEGGVLHGNGEVLGDAPLQGVEGLGHVAVGEAPFLDHHVRRQDRQVRRDLRRVEVVHRADVRLLQKVGADLIEIQPARPALAIGPAALLG